MWIDISDQLMVILFDGGIYEKRWRVFKRLLYIISYMTDLISCMHIHEINTQGKRGVKTLLFTRMTNPKLSGIALLKLSLVLGRYFDKNGFLIVFSWNGEIRVIWVSLALFSSHVPLPHSLPEMTYNFTNRHYTSLPWCLLLSLLWLPFL